ncbi:MAG: DNA-binding response regulator [Planctomycetota bacterium]|nr:MAG: DNA-binding response regulator [Planctomycetota bacterium]
MAKTEPVVFIVDDNEEVLKSLGKLIEAAGFNVRTFASGQEFLESSDFSSPGCLVLDVRMPGMSGLKLQNKLAEHRSQLPIIFITGHGDVSTAIEAFKGGAVDFIEKPFSEQKLLDSINKAIETSLKNYRNQIEIADIQQKMDTLTSREREILDGIVGGKTNKLIGLELNLSPKTVDYHRCNIMEKMGVNRAVQLTKLVMKATGS